MRFNPDGQMYELYAAVAAIRVEGKSYDDICTRVPIADIFHSTRRGRRDAVLTEALTPLQASPCGHSGALPRMKRSTEQLNSATELRHRHQGPMQTADAQQTKSKSKSWPDS